MMLYQAASIKCDSSYRMLGNEVAIQNGKVLLYMWKTVNHQEVAALVRDKAELKQISENPPNLRNSDMITKRFR